MIDKDTLRTARRTVERNGYTVLPPRDRDERDLDRFRTRREVTREDRDSRPAPRPRYRDVVRDEEPARRFKPLRGREDDTDERPVRRPTRTVDRDYDYEDRKPVRRTRDIEDYDDRPVSRPARREMNDDEKLGAAIRTAEENGFTIRKMSKLDQAKQIARDNGFEVRRADRPVRPTAADGEGKPGGRPQRTLVKPVTKPNVEDGIRTRTAPDTEINADAKVPTGVDSGNDAAAAEQKKNTYADDFMNRAAKFFGEDN